MKLNELQEQEAESLGHYIKYILSKPNVETHPLYDALKKMADFGRFLSNFSEKEGNEISEKYFEVDDIEEIVDLFLERLMKELEKKAK